MKIFFIIISISLLVSSVGWGTNTYNLKTDFGAKGDGKTDDSKALADAIKELNKVKTGKLIIPKGVYRIGAQKIDTLVGNNLPYASPLYPYTLNDLNGVSIVGETDKTGKSLSVFKLLDNLHYGFFNMASGDAPPSTTIDYQANCGAVFSLGWTCKNVTIKDLELDGNLSKTIYQVAPKGKRSYDLLYIGISSYGGTNIILDNIYVHHFGLDGIYVRNGKELQEGASFNFFINNSRSEYNGRQGLSFTAGHHLKVSKSSFKYTGMGGIRISPCANVDIENHDRWEGVLSNIVFEECHIADNKGGSGSLHIAGKVDNILFKDCIIEAGKMVEGTNRIYAISMQFSPSRNVKFDNCQINGAFGMTQKGKKMEESGKTIFEKCVFNDNLRNDYPDDKIAILLDVYDYVYFNKCTFYLHPKRSLIRSYPSYEGDNRDGVNEFVNCIVYNQLTGKRSKKTLDNLPSRYLVRSNGLFK